MCLYIVICFNSSFHIHQCAPSAAHSGSCTPLVCAENTLAQNKKKKKTQNKALSVVSVHLCGFNLKAIKNKFVLNNEESYLAVIVFT